MKRALKYSIILLMSAMLVVPAVKAQNTQAYVDVNKVLQAMPGYQDSTKKLDEIRAMYQNQYNYLLVDLQQKIKMYEAQKDSLSAYIANIRLREIKNAQANLDTFQAVANSALNIQKNKMLSGFLSDIKDAIAAIGNEKKYNTIWDYEMLKNAIWTDPKTDITQEVISRLDKKKNPIPNKK